MKTFTSKKIKELQTKEKLTRTENIFYLNDMDLKKSGVIINYTQDEMIEYAKCYHDKIYFIEKYLKIKLYEFQKRIIEHYNDNRYSIFMKSDQIKKNHNILYIDYKGKNELEFFNNLKKHYKILPFFLKPGITTWNAKSINFDNDNRITSQKASLSIGIGYHINTLIIHDFAYIPSNIIESLYNSLIPTMSALSDSRIVLASAPNGKNLFNTLVEKSELKSHHPDKNMYEVMRIDYRVIPGRDKEWKRRTIELLGDNENAEQIFAHRYELRFVGTRERKFKRIIKFLKE